MRSINFLLTYLLTYTLLLHCTAGLSFHKLQSIDHWRRHCGCPTTSWQTLHVWHATTRVLKSNVVDLLAPFLAELFNRSLSLGSVPVIFKAAYITPRLKKPDADPADVTQYRPVSNLSVLSNWSRGWCPGSYLATWLLSDYCLRN